MRNEPNKKMIGLFMAIGIGVFSLIVGAYLQNKFLGDKAEVVVMYFEESIKGLNVGSSVVFKGVEIGKVAKIDLITNPVSLDFSIPVYVRMERQTIRSIGEYRNKQEVLDALIQKGLRARLATQSYVTGQLMVEFEILPNTPIVLKNTNPKYMEIPTTLSSMGELSKGLQSLPIRHSVESFNKFFDSLNDEMPRISNVISKLEKSVSGSARTTTDALNNFNKAMVNVGDAAKSIRNLSDYLERHPEAVFKGKGRD